jgi:hypothetical protein
MGCGDLPYEIIAADHRWRIQKAGCKLDSPGLGLLFCAQRPEMGELLKSASRSGPRGPEQFQWQRASLSKDR